MGNPGPCGYCSLEHGQTLFPDLLKRLVAGPDPYALYGIARRVLCVSVRGAGLTCDPSTCLPDLERSPAEALATDHATAAWAWRCKYRYQRYREEHDAATERGETGEEIAELLRDLDLGPDASFGWG